MEKPLKTKLRFGAIKIRITEPPLTILIIAKTKTEMHHCMSSHQPKFSSFYVS